MLPVGVYITGVVQSTVREAESANDTKIAAAVAAAITTAVFAAALRISTSRVKDTFRSTFGVWCRTVRLQSSCCRCSHGCPVLIILSSSDCVCCKRCNLVSSLLNLGNPTFFHDFLHTSVRSGRSGALDLVWLNRAERLMSSVHIYKCNVFELHATPL